MWEVLKTQYMNEGGKAYAIWLCSPSFLLFLIKQ